MNIGNRKKRSDDEFIPEFTKRCDLKNIDCKYCILFSKQKNWCLQYMNEYYEELKNGKKIK